jgi:hypothetical protein
MVTQKHHIPSKDAAGNPVVDSAGNAVLVERDVRRRMTSIQALPTNTAKFEALHPFPNPLFPMNAGGGMAASMAGTLLRKRLEPMEENWVEERIRKASEWCFVPEEWGITPRKPDTTTSAAEDEDDEDTVPESERLDSEAIPTTRVKDVLSGDEIVHLWKHAHQEVFDIKYLRQKYPASYPDPGAQDAGEGEGEEEEDGDDEEDEEEEEFEDVMDTSGGAETETKDVVKPKVVRKKVTVGKLPVHEPVDGVPVLSLGFAHKFSEIGEV